MCSNYVAVSRADRLLSFFGVQRERDDPPVDTWPTGLAPFIRLAEPGSGHRRVVDDGVFGLLPSFAKELVFGRKTYNARSETVHQLPSFRDAWRRGQRCIVPAEIIFEPNYESGKAMRWAIQQPGAVPMGIAGIYTRWRHPDGRELFSFAMLTVNADQHPFYSRFHRPGDEKRMPIILAPAEYDAWLSCSVQAAPQFFLPWPGPLETEPAPLPPRAPLASSVRTTRPPKPAPPAEGSLF
ncbi:MAG TPA: SOS response-associated peptidase family protein [Ramlibacter sp.]|nr:SOS response-associated peptidase family protein [Ramlibacter sp.]